MNPNESLDRLQERCDKAEAALRESQRELADYAVDMEKANKELAGYKLALSQQRDTSEAMSMLEDAEARVLRLTAVLQKIAPAVGRWRGLRRKGGIRDEVSK
jgi:chromosome segregation ATPase